MLKLSYFISILFFPGIIIHELAHIIACLILGVKIHSVNLLSFDGGYVAHEESKSYKTVVIALFPFIFNILIAILIGAYLVYIENNYIKGILSWIAISSLFYAFPSSQDSANVYESIKRSYTKRQSIIMWFIKIMLLPITILILVFSFLIKIMDKLIIFRICLIMLWIYLFLVIV
ncbi:MAG: hypothetical protein V1824_04080 [archaeon]